MKLVVREVGYRLKVPLRTSNGPISHREGFLVEVFGDGAVGLGEAMPLPDFGSESKEQSRWALEEATSRWKDERPPQALDDVTDLVAQVPQLSSCPSARFALELSLLDLLGKRRGLSVADLLGRQRSQVEVNALLSLDGAMSLAAEAAQAIRSGFRTLKLKVGAGPLSEDLDRVAAVRKAVGSDIQLRVDANGGWSQADAERALEALSVFGLELCEQPVPKDAWEALARLARLKVIPIAADESLQETSAPGSILTSGVDVLVLKPQALGGLLPALELAKAARASGVSFYVTSFLDGPVGLAGAAHLAASLPEQRMAFAHGLGTGALFEGVSFAPYEIFCGRMSVPNAPGLGLR